jgi:CRP/FNR family transcriptional regulator
MRPDEARSIFDAYPVLAGVSADLQARIRSEMRPIRAEDRHGFFDVDDDCSALPLVAVGTVRVVKPLSTGRVVPLYRLARGEFCVLSVSCLLGDVLYPAAGQAAGEVVGGALPKALFRTLVDQEPSFRNEVFGVFASRLCLLMAVIEEMAVARLDERLAELLVARGPVVHATHQSLADELGTAREVVSRILEHFETEGLVRLRRANVDVLDPENLARACVARPIG